MSVALQIHLEFSEKGNMKVVVLNEKGERIPAQVEDAFREAISRKNVVSIQDCLIAFTHDSPGCVCVRLGGKAYRYCR